MSKVKKGCRQRISLVGAMAAWLCLAVCSGCQERGIESLETIRIGVALYNGDDKFIEELQGQMEKLAACQSGEGPRIQLDIVDGESRQVLQNQQVEQFIRQDYDVICVNLVDRVNAAVIGGLAESAQIPLIFFNREPLEEDVCDREQVYYIGSDAATSASMQAQIVIDAYREKKKNIDKNGDGTISYAMLEGELGHQDSIIRTERSVEALEDAGLCLKKIQSGCANFERSQASALVGQWLEEDPKIELILSNNDDMALGAIDAIEAAGLEKQVTVVGIDGTEEGKRAVDEGKMLGTVESDSQLYAKTLYEAACSLATSGELSTQIQQEEERYVWIPWEYYLGKDKKE